MKVAIIDYGLGNIKSIFNACKFFSKDIIISNNYEDAVKEMIRIGNELGLTVKIAPDLEN